MSLQRSTSEDLVTFAASALGCEPVEKQECLDLLTSPPSISRKVMKMYLPVSPAGPVNRPRRLALAPPNGSEAYHPVTVMEYTMEEVKAMEAMEAMSKAKECPTLLFRWPTPTTPMTETTLLTARVHIQMAGAFDSLHVAYFSLTLKQIASLERVLQHSATTGSAPSTWLLSKSTLMDIITIMSSPSSLRSCIQEMSATSIWVAYTQTSAQLAKGICWTSSNTAQKTVITL